MDEERHIPLPLKYRPNNFAELIGQELMAQTIKNAIKLNRIANAIYLLECVVLVKLLQQELSPKH